MAWIVAFFVQTGSHLINDAFDLKKGADTAARLGPIRVTQMGLLSFKQAYWGGISCLICALVFGVPLVEAGGLPVLAILLASVVAAYIYTGGPYPLAYTGISDLFVLIFYGWVCTGAVYYVLVGHYDSTAFLLGLQLGLLCTIMLAINNLRDTYTDSLANKRTLAVRFGTFFGRMEITLLSFVPFFFNIFWWFQGYTLSTLLPLLALPLALKLVRNIWTHDPGPLYNQFLGMGALLHLLFGFLLSISFILQRIS